MTECDVDAFDIGLEIAAIPLAIIILVLLPIALWNSGTPKSAIILFEVFVGYVLADTLWNLPKYIRQYLSCRRGDGDGRG